MTHDKTPAPSFPQGQPFTTAQAHRAGFSDRMLAIAVARGHLVKLRHGWFQTPTAELKPRLRAARDARVALREAPAGAIASHRTAAALHGLPLLRTRDDLAHITVDRPNGGRTNGHARIHSSPPGTLTATEIDGIPVTSVARTLVDLSRASGFRAGVCAADYALRKELITPEEFQRELAMHRGRKAVAIARDVAGFADPRAESAGESLSRCVMRDLVDIPAPTLQRKYFERDGLLVARTDFSWGDGALAGEFDGKVKYTRGAAFGDDPSETVWKEKQREDRLRDLGVVVIRWVWTMLYRPEQFRRLLLTGLRRAQVC